MNNTLKILFVDNPDLAEQVCAFCDTRRSSGRRRSGSMPSVTRRRGGWARGFIWNLRRRGRAITFEKNTRKKGKSMVP